nr:putative disease resistance rpp13-like protein 1 [Quercus suber]
MSIVLEAVAGAALSAFFDVLIDKLSSPDLLKIFRQESVDADLKKWKIILQEIGEVLDDAEEKQTTKESVKTWMAELEDLAYDADDILDEFATEALRRKVKAEEATTSKIRKFVPACCVGLNPSSIMFNADMRSKIKEINKKLQEIVTRKNDLKLEDFARGRTRTITSRVPATSLVESHTYGREEDKEAIVKLLSDESSGAQLSTISILEGLVRETEGEKPMEDLGAQWAAGDFCCRLEDQLGGSKISTKGTLSISHLENMLDANDARKVNLKGKKNLDTLVMKWDDDLQDAEVATDILDMLRPHKTMKTLSIKGYVGANFPTWLGDSYFSKMVDLRIERCGKCVLLPAFGQLPFLKHLVIMRMDRVQSVTPEFYGEHCKQPFRSLVKLCFEDMYEWQDWLPCNQDFPCLHELSISKGPKLQGKLPYHLPEKLSIYACEQLVVSIPSYSVFQELKIERCKEVVHGSLKVKKLIIENCKELEIEIESCQSLVNIELKSTLRTLTIKGCSALESLLFVMDEGGASSTSPSLMNEENLSCIGNNNASLLEHLKISNCPSLKCVSTIVDVAAMLNHLDIEECPKLTSLSSKDTLPTTLKVLRLVDCPKLESIVDKLNKDTLLEHLLIRGCEKLRCLPRGLHKLCHLKEIYIHNCNRLISVGNLLPTNLRSLHIEDSEKLEALPNNMHNLNFLQHLSMYDCPSIISFPEEGFPTNLRELWLSGAKCCEQVFELGLHRLTSLTYLSIGSGIMDSFPEKEDGNTMLMLPTSLTTLRFYKFPNLLFLSWKLFQNLSVLEEISIVACPKLASLSEKCFPPLLQRLDISNCPVNNFAKQRDLPSSVAIEASFKTWRRLHIMLRNNDRSCLAQMIKVFLLVLQMAATPCKFRNVWQVLIFGGGGGGFGADKCLIIDVIRDEVGKVHACFARTEWLEKLFEIDKIKTGHYAKMTSNCYMNIFWSSAGSY